MTRCSRLTAVAVLCVVGSLALAPASGRAGLMDAVKSATKKSADAVKAAAQAGPAKPGAPPAGADSASGGTSTPSAASSGATVSTISTKFDFVPGDSVLFIDDFRRDELGEFPARWRLVEGTFEVAEMEGERWARCTSVGGHIRMKVLSGLPELWTLEFDFYAKDLDGSIALTVNGLTASGDEGWQMRFPYSGTTVEAHSGKVGSMTPFAGPIPGRHHVMFMARGAALKVYVDRERMANLPDVSGAGKVVEFDIQLWGPARPMITNVRLAEGPRPPKDMLEGGKLVTYGILFQSGSDVVLPESAPVLRQVAAYLESNAAVKLRITGHTDNVGSSASNLDLSKRRAASVAKVLATQFAIASERLAADGKGDTQPVSPNAGPEGRAMNRRVEFAKL